MPRTLLVAAALLPVLAACAALPTSPTDADPGASASAPASASALAGDAGDARATPSATATTPTATTPTASPSPEVPDEPCRGTTVWPGSSSDCSARAQELLAATGLYDGEVRRWYAPAAVNAMLNFQRSRDLPAHGAVDDATWVALLTGAPETLIAIPEECTVDGDVLCASQAHRILWYLRDGVLLRTVPVRFGGWTTTKDGTWRNHPTANGTYSVYAKDASPCSERYGCGVMPYSLMFHPDMYVHYSQDFSRVGYAGSSHGCINVGSLEDATWLFENVPVGTTVVVYGPQPWAE